MSSTPQNPLKQTLKKTVLVLISIYIMVSSLLYFLQEKLLFFPSVLEQDYTYEFKQPFEELFLTMSDGAIINAIHFKKKQPKGVILYFHGNAGDLSRWGGIAEYFVEMDYDVFIIDYRTYGKSTGVLSEQVFYDDAQYCYDYLKEGYSENQITLYGRSLGTGIATYLASQNRPKQLILETPYYSIVDVAASRFPILPVEKLLKYKFPSFRFIENVTCPVTMFHGTEDELIPITSAQKLFEASPKSLTSFIIIEGGGHSNLINYDDYHKGIEKILP